MNVFGFKDLLKYFYENCEWSIILMIIITTCQIVRLI